MLRRLLQLNAQQFLNTVVQYSHCLIFSEPTMRIPFQTSVTVGADIVLSSRIANVGRANPRRLARMTARFLHPLERQDFARRFPDWQDFAKKTDRQQERISIWLAGRWAAKEAAKKAWGAALLGFKDVRVEICGDEGNIQMVCAPQSAGANNTITEQVAQLSISHDGDYAMAVVIATPLHPDILTELGYKKAEAEAKTAPRKFT